MKVLLAVRSLSVGGTERQVVALARALTAENCDVHIALIATGGELESEIRDDTQIDIHVLGGSGLSRFGSIRRLVKHQQYDAVYGFLPNMNLLLLGARLMRNRPVIAWGVRSSALDLSQYSSRVKWAIRLEKALSGLSDRIITNSQAALDEYRQKGYPHSKLTHIPNAIDVDRFKPDPNARRSVRAELGISDGTPLVGLFARIHPMKDHLTFLRAARILIENTPATRFICAGGSAADYETYEQRIRANATELGLDENVLWLGARNDPEKLMAACDITTLTSSSGEGFPNSVAESMACGTPCVVTDVGDAASIVSVHGAAVPRTNPEELAEAWKMVLDKDPYASDQASAEGRQSIIDRYSSAAIARATLDVLSQ